MCITRFVLVHAWKPPQHPEVSFVQALPFVIKTPSQRRHKAALEARLQEIEEALDVFSQPKVLVQS
jgi:hypothetical protein